MICPVCNKEILAGQCGGMCNPCYMRIANVRNRERKRAWAKLNFTKPKPQPELKAAHPYSIIAHHDHVIGPPCRGQILLDIQLKLEAMIAEARKRFSSVGLID